MADFFIFLIVAMALSIPLTLIGTYHARKMAEIAKRGSTNESELRMQHEIAELRQLIAQQAIVLDDVATMHRRLLQRADDDQSLKNRLGPQA
ncbi:MAG: hypothetical protein P4L46_23440 [Fimbriimonas sp.]|nr:hypothetical protein [Fimbriimonas sp.]